MADTKDKYTDENASDDFAAGFEHPEKTGPALVPTDAEEDGDKAEGDKPEGKKPEDGEGAEGGNTEGGETTEGDKPDGADEVVTLTKMQLDRLMAAAEKTDGYEAQIRQLFGKQGDMQNLVKQLQTATPKGMKVEIPADAFKEMEEEYPAIAAHMKTVLEKSLSNIKGTGDAASAEGDDKVNKGIKPEEIQSLAETIAINREMKVLEEEHPNWRQDVGAVEGGQEPDPKHPFRAWLAKQPAGYRKMIDETDSPLVVGKAIDKFKAYQAAQKKAPPAPPSKQVEVRKDRIADAVTQKGDGSPPKNRQSADEAFAEGFATG